MSHAAAIQSEKTALRTDIRARVAAMTPEARAEAARDCIRALTALPAFASATSVLAYSSFGDEINTAPLLAEVLAAGKRLALPRITAGDLTLHQVPSLDALIPGTWGIREPSPDAPLITLKEIELAIVPGVAFDLTGSRMGYGKGYYDRLLAGDDRLLAGDDRLLSSAAQGRTRNTNVIALAYDCQCVDHVPVTVRDQKIDMLITPSQTNAFSHDCKTDGQTN